MYHKNNMYGLKLKLCMRLFSTRRRVLSSYQADNVNDVKLELINQYYRNLGSLIDDILSGYKLKF